MTFKVTLGEHFMMAASAYMFHIAIDCKYKSYMKVSACKTDINTSAFP